MYKTVRHGENSLQYTILPQTEELLNNSGVKGTGRDYSPSIHVRRVRKRSPLKYTLLVFFWISVALTLAAIPLLIMNNTMIARLNELRHHETATLQPLTPAGSEIIKSKKKELILPQSIILTTLLKTKQIDTTTPQPSTTTTTEATTEVKDKVATATWIIPALKSWNSVITYTTTTQDTKENDPLLKVPLIRAPNSYASTNPAERVVQTVTESAMLRNTVTPRSPTVNVPVKSNYVPKFTRTTSTTIKPPLVRQQSTQQTTTYSKFNSLKEAILSVDDDNDFKESLEVDEVFSLPTQKQEVSDDSDEVIIRKVENTWFRHGDVIVDRESWRKDMGQNLLVMFALAALTTLILCASFKMLYRRKRNKQLESLRSELNEELNPTEDKEDERLVTE